MYLGKGNKKLSKKTVIWSIPAIKTCPHCTQCASTCYARKAERLYPQVLPCREQNLIDSKKATFTIDMTVYLSQIIVNAKKYKPDTVRIHESGDFYSREYAWKWIKIARNFPELQFYSYTKAPENIPWDNLPKNMNIILSILPDGELNFGTHETVNKLAKKYRAKICPYGRAKKPVICGENCKACQNRKYVVFDKH